MAARAMSEGFKDLVDELKQLEDFFPLLASVEDRDEVAEEIRELEQLIAVAGEPADEHSMRALLYLQTELVRKREIFDDLI